MANNHTKISILFNLESVYDENKILATRREKVRYIGIKYLWPNKFFDQTIFNGKIRRKQMKIKRRVRVCLSLNISFLYFKNNIEKTIHIPTLPKSIIRQPNIPKLKIKPFKSTLSKDSAQGDSS